MPTRKKIELESAPGTEISPEESHYKNSRATVVLGSYVAFADFEQPWTIYFHKDTKHPDQVTGSQSFSVSVAAGEEFNLPEGWARDENYEKNILTKNSERKGIPFLTPSGARVILPVKEA